MIKKQNQLTALSIFLLVFSFALVTEPAKSQEMPITLTWSTNTYIPANYIGKALPIRESQVEIAANIDSPNLNPDNLSYFWSVNHYINKNGSGRGKQTFIFNTKSTNSDYLITVEVRSANGSLLGSPSLPIRVQEPEIVLKTDIPSSVLKKSYIISSEQEINFLAQPYFFNIKNISQLNYKWTLGQQEALEISRDKPNLFSVRVGQIKDKLVQELKVLTSDKKRPEQRSRTKANLIFTP